MVEEVQEQKAEKRLSFSTSMSTVLLRETSPTRAEAVHAASEVSR